MTIIKTEKDKKEFIGLITEAFQEIMIPALDDMEYRIMQRLGENVQTLSSKIDSLERKFDAQQERSDKHNERIERLEKIHPQGKHSPAIA